MNYAKYANWYDAQGNIVNKKDENGKTRDYTIAELEELVVKLAEDKDENGMVKDPQALINTNAILFQMYQKYGNPNEANLIERIKQFKASKTTEEEKVAALKELDKELSTVDMDEEYVEFEEVKA